MEERTDIERDSGLEAERGAGLSELGDGDVGAVDDEAIGHHERDAGKLESLDAESDRGHEGLEKRAQEAASDGIAEDGLEMSGCGQINADTHARDGEVNNESELDNSEQEKDQVTMEARSAKTNPVTPIDRAEVKANQVLNPVRPGRNTRATDDKVPAGLPATRVKRIVKLDKDIRLVNKEGIFAIIQATQHFLEALAAESISQAWKCKRKGVKADDILVAAKKHKFRECLGSTLSDFVLQLNQEDTDAEDSGSGNESPEEDGIAVAKKCNKEAMRKRLQRPPGNRSITDFF